MSYFHVVFNIKKRYAVRLGLEGWRELHGHIQRIHMSRSLNEKNVRVREFTVRYKKDKPTAEDLFEYVNTQWLTGAFCNWMTWHTVIYTN